MAVGPDDPWQGREDWWKISTCMETINSLNSCLRKHTERGDITPLCPIPVALPPHFPLILPRTWLRVEKLTRQAQQGLLLHRGDASFPNPSWLRSARGAKMENLMFTCTWHYGGVLRRKHCWAGRAWGGGSRIKDPMGPRIPRQSGTFYSDLLLHFPFHVIYHHEVLEHPYMRRHGRLRPLR